LRPALRQQADHRQPEEQDVWKRIPDPAARQKHGEIARQEQRHSTHESPSVELV